MAASNTFVLPTLQVHALIMRPAGYRTVDIGLTLVSGRILIFVVLIGMLYLF